MKYPGNYVTADLKGNYHLTNRIKMVVAAMTK